jgi:hypothetical protein
MTTEENIKEKLEELAHAISPDEKLAENVMNRINAFQTFSSSIGPVQNIWRLIMKSPITRIGVAAVIIIACFTSLHFWRSTGSGIVLADVLANIEHVNAFSLKWNMKINIEDPKKPYNYEGHGTELISQEYGSKNTEIGEESDSNGSLSTFQEIYFLPRKNVRIHIRPNQKKYVRVELSDMYVKKEQGRGGLELQNNPLGYLKKMLEYEYESLGRSTINGIDVAGFRSTDPNMWRKWERTSQNFQSDVKLWVNVKTLLPIRYEYEHHRQTAGNTKDHMHMVYSDFQWNISVDAAEFMPSPIPDGYVIEDLFPDVANEESATQGLKQCVELLGKYPQRIDLTYLWSESEKSETSAALRLKEELKGLTGLERDNKKMDALKPIRFLYKFYAELVKTDFVYYGKTVTPKDTDKVLLRWKLDDGRYRVIFGGLHADTVTADALKELETALQQ